MEADLQLGRISAMGKRLLLFINACVVLAALGLLCGVGCSAWLVGLISGVIDSNSSAAFVQAVALLGLPLSPQMSLPQIIAMAAFGILNAACIIFIFRKARGFISLTLREATPFRAEQAAQLRKLAYAATVMCVAGAGLLLALGATGLSANMAAVYPAIGLALAVMFYYLAYIIEYGAALQTLADETL
jgi:hypothetical protein